MAKIKVSPIGNIRGGEDVKINVDGIRKIMKDRGLSLRMFSASIGVSPSCMSRIINGQREPSTLVVGALKNAFPEYPLDYFFDSSVTNKCHNKPRKAG